MDKKINYKVLIIANIIYFVISAILLFNFAFNECVLFIITIPAIFGAYLGRYFLLLARVNIAGKMLAGAVYAHLMPLFSLFSLIIYGNLQTVLSDESICNLKVGYLWPYTYQDLDFAIVIFLISSLLCTFFGSIYGIRIHFQKEAIIVI